jgi:hypothetical protein
MTTVAAEPELSLADDMGSSERRLIALGACLDKRPGDFCKCMLTAVL